MYRLAAGWTRPCWKRDADAEVDPVSPDALGTVAVTLFYARRYDEALTESRRATQLASKSAFQHLLLGRILAARRAFSESLGELGAAARLSDNAPAMLKEIARTYAIAGHTVEARELLERLVASYERGEASVPAPYLAYVYAALGDRGQALSLLRSREVQVRQRHPVGAC